MDLDVSMRSGSCPYTVKFFGAMVEEVCGLDVIFAPYTHVITLDTEMIN